MTLTYTVGDGKYYCYCEFADVYQKEEIKKEIYETELSKLDYLKPFINEKEEFTFDKGSSKYIKEVFYTEHEVLKNVEIRF